MDKSPAPMTSIDLREITRGLQEAASAANSMIAQQYIELFDRFFDCNHQELGAPMTAKMVEVAMDGQHLMRVPLFALVSPKGLALERMQVDLSVRVQNTEARQAPTPADESRAASFKVTIGGQGRQGDSRDPDEVQIRMQFQASEPPEALNRLIEEYTNLIVPVRAPAPAPPPSSSNEFIEAATVR